MPRKAAPKRKTARKTTKTKRRKREADFESRVDDFAEEVERLGRKFEKKGDEWDTWFHKTFGLVGPLISSIFGIIIFAIAIWIIGIVNVPLSSVFLSNVISFLTVNMGMFFLIFMFFSYTSYFSKAWKKIYVPFSPLFTAVGISIALWVIAHAIRIANVTTGSVVLSEIYSAIFGSLFWVFLFFFFVGYLLLVLKINAGKHPHITPDGVFKHKPRILKSRKTNYRMQRLYRSGEDKILGGVCGGIGAYLGIDPVIIRLIWVLAFFAWGIGILAYIIAWIIIPRNPRHSWED